MILLALLFGATVHAQTSFKTIIDENVLRKEAMARTVFFRMYADSDTSKAIKASGIILKDGYLLTNEHVLRPHLEGKKVVFHIFTQGKKILHKYEELSVLECDKVNDLCLLKTAKRYNDSFFTFEVPSFRKTSEQNPVGLFKDEEIYFNGFCDELPSMKKAKYIDFKTSAYETKIAGLEQRSTQTTAIQFSAVSGEGIACGGDSGGPLFDGNLYLYGIVRDSVAVDGTKKNYAVPLKVMKEFFDRAKNAGPKSRIQTITDFSELEKIF